MQNGEAIHAYAVAAYDGIDPESEERERVYIQARREAIGGITIRDYFATQAMQGICAHQDTWGIATSEGIAKASYEVADDMLAERAK